MPKKKTFEDALNELDSIIEELESGSPTLNKMMQLYEDGMSLAKECKQKIKDAEQKIKIINKDNSEEDSNLWL